MEEYTKFCERISIFLLILAFIFYVINCILIDKNKELRSLNTKPSYICNCKECVHCN